MLRRVALRRMSFTAGGGSALHVESPAPSKPKPAGDVDEPAGVLLPWTARPWAVTHSVHHAQWKFLDTVFAHLATVTPAELSERAREQGARDVLRDLEEPVIALLRQQARQARQQRREAKAAQQDAAAKTAEALDTGAVAAPGVSTSATLASSLTAPAASKLERGSDAGSAKSPASSGAKASVAAVEAAVTADTPQHATTPSGTAAPSTTSKSAQEMPARDSAAHAASTSDATSSSSGGRRKHAKKSKASKKAVDVIHYL